MNFLDTNILLYALGPDEDPERSPTAREIVGRNDNAYSVQIFQEFFVQATHKRRKDPLSHEEAEAILESLACFPIQENTLPLFREALIVRRQYQLSYWDAMVIAAAASLRCKTLFSEDLNHGQSYGEVTVINPFRAIH